MTLPSYSVEFLLVERRLFERRLPQCRKKLGHVERRCLQRRTLTDQLGSKSEHTNRAAA